MRRDPSGRTLDRAATVGPTRLAAMREATRTRMLPARDLRSSHLGLDCFQQRPSIVAQKGRVDLLLDTGSDLLCIHTILGLRKALERVMVELRILGEQWTWLTGAV